jgi:hypothetical protein
LEACAIFQSKKRACIAKIGETMFDLLLGEHNAKGNAWKVYRLAFPPSMLVPRRYDCLGQEEEATKADVNVRVEPVHRVNGLV